jgi:hypothetical protein
MTQRRLLAALIAGLALSALVSSCGDDVIEQGTTAPPATDSRDSGSVASPPAAPDAPPPAGSGGAAAIQSRSDLVGASPLEPESVVTDPSNDRRLLVRFWGGVEPCFGAEIRVAESATDVKVTVLGGAPPGAQSRTCIALARLYQATVELQSPLGSRTIVVAK